jgi:hypothetical protein
MSFPIEAGGYFNWQDHNAKVGSRLDDAGAFFSGLINRNLN